jgi:pimeloyl-ACP methyl ester carboxylesterase
MTPIVDGRYVGVVGRSRFVLAAAAVVAALFACASGASGAGSPVPGSTEQLTLTMSDGAQLACSVTYPENVPNGPLPGGGHAGVILFPGLGQTHADLQPLAQALAGDGYESLACDARGTGASEGEFGLDGSRDVQDAQDLYTWLSGQLGNDRVGAVGLSLGGGEVWNAAVAGVPFKAIVPAATWTNLAPALAPHGVPKAGLVHELATTIPAARWDPTVAQARDDLLAGSVTPAVQVVERIRSSRSRLHSLTVPTLILQGRHDFLFDLDQALAAYRLLAGPKLLYLGDLGHAPATNPVAEQPVYVKLAATFLDEYLKGMSGVNAGAGGPVQLAHDPWDGTTTSFAGIPPTRHVSVNLPGKKRLASSKLLRRTVRLTGGPLETFGDGSVTVRYSHASGWTHLAATVLAKGQKAPVTVGAAPLTKTAGVVRIPLLDEAVFLPRGKPLVVKLGGTSLGGVFTQGVPGGARITIERVTLRLSVLRRAVSR